MSLTRTSRIFEYQVPRGHFPHAEVLKYNNTYNSETSKEEIRIQFRYRDLLMFKLAYLGEILKADWNVLGAHNKLFYCSTILETSSPPPPGPLLNTNFILTKLFNIHSYNPSIESIFKPLLRPKKYCFSS